MATTTFVELASVSSQIPVQRRLTLEMLQRFGPLALESFPRAWPLGREHQLRILRELESGCAVAMIPDPKVPGRTLARITEVGTELLRDMDDEAMRAWVLDLPDE